MRRLWRGFGVFAIVLLFATAAAAAFPRYAFELLPPHSVQRSSAVLSDELKRAIDSSVAEAQINTPAKARDFALAATDKLLHFGLSHRANMTFSTSEREGNCIEYAHLFARVFDRVAAKAGLLARAYPVHSDKAHVFGKKLPFAGFENHDWVLIQDGSGPAAILEYVDPTLHDAGLGWDVSSNVKGEVKAPR